MFRSLKRFKVNNYNNFLSNVALNRKPSPIRALQPFMRIPGMISLGGGTPNPSCFPISNISFTTLDGKVHQVDCKEALQYSPTPGHPAFVEQLLMLVKATNPRLSDETSSNLRLCVTTGSQDALAKAFETFLNPGDTLITENPTYSGSLAFLVPHGVKLCGIAVDGEGMKVDVLEQKLANWNEPEDGKFPKIIYSIPTGANPTGATLTDSRRQKLYDLCCKYNMILMEDDPYFHLYFHHDSKPLRTMLDRDTEGRVIRFESFSKILTAGARIGYAVGPSQLVERIELHTQATSLHTSGISQGICQALIHSWGIEGFLTHCKSVAAFYYQRSNVFESLMQKHMSHLATWTKPDAGMFYWINLEKSGVTDSNAIINDLANQKVLLLPGSVFSTTASGTNSSFVRASFSMASDDQMEEALKRLRFVCEAKQRV